MSQAVAALAPEKASETNWEKVWYEECDRVLWIAVLNHRPYMSPGDRLSGTVISAFNAAGMRIYRIRLDLRWLKERDPLQDEAQMIVGNV